MEGFRPEDKGRLDEKEAFKEANTLKLFATLIVNHEIKKMEKKLCIMISQKNLKNLMITGIDW